MSVIYTSDRDYWGDITRVTGDSLYLVEHVVDNDVRSIMRGLPYYVSFTFPADCNVRDGEWYATITMPYEAVEWDGYHVPVWEGDVERREWEEARRR